MVLLSCPLPSALADPSSQHQLQALAGQGDANAQWMLGQALLTGSLGETDEAEAVRWLQLAADQGHALFLGPALQELLAGGARVDAHPERADSAAPAGHARMAANLGQTGGC